MPRPAYAGSVTSAGSATGPWKRTKDRRTHTAYTNHQVHVARKGNHDSRCSGFHRLLLRRSQAHAQLRRRYSQRSPRLVAQGGEFTCADILRHIASGEKMFVGVVTQSKWKYDGHGGDQRSLADLLAHLDQAHREAMEALRSLPDSELDQTRPALEGNTQVRAWRWLMAMVEHEIHHRGQLAMYLLLMEITPPHLYGLGVEDLIARATG